MDVLKAIRERRSIGLARPECPPREAIETILEAATWAPNHYKVEPWRFTVLAGEGRKRLSDVDVAILAESLPAHLSEAQRRAAIEKQREKVLRAPVIIVVTVEKPANEKVLYVENVAAVAAAIQNMLLAAHALGLATKWRTGLLAHHPKTKALFHLDSDQDILGFIYVGYPAEEPDTAERRPIAEKTEWWGWPD